MMKYKFYLIFLIVFIQCNRVEKVETKKVKSTEILLSKTVQRTLELQKKFNQENKIEFVCKNDSLKQTLAVGALKSNHIIFQLITEDLKLHRTVTAYGNAKLVKKSEIGVLENGKKYEYEEYVDNGVCQTVIRIDKTKSFASIESQNCKQVKDMHKECDEAPGFVAIGMMNRKR